MRDEPRLRDVSICIYKATTFENKHGYLKTTTVTKGLATVREL